tara:strand:+ start:375 stop:578 length:204 start_codon:yes stop_codon:yes gene_type:complete
MSIKDKEKAKEDLIGNLYTIEQQDGKYSALMQISGFITEESAQIYMSNHLKNANQHIFMVESPPTIH